MREASKASIRRQREGGPWTAVFVGHGLDIGPGDDPCDRVHRWGITQLECFEREQGDANFIRQHFADESFDFIHASHSLEHMRRHPWHCVQDWACLLKVGGHLVITVPDFEMFEKRCWPSRNNSDHRWAFHTEPIEGAPWVIHTPSIAEPLADAGMALVHVRRLTAGWDPADLSDQTLEFERGIECAWEILAVKRRHVDLMTPVTVRRQHALGDTIAVTAFYNHLARRHEVTFQTSAAYLDYHLGVAATADLSRPADLDLDDYDRAHPYVPLYQLGFHKAGIPVPQHAEPTILLTPAEAQQIALAKQERYALIDISTIPLMSRSIWFDVLEVAEHLASKGLEVRYLEPCAPRDLVVLIGGAALVIGRDSGPIQIAQALQTPYVALMSSVLPEARYIRRANARTLASPCPIREDGCYHRHWLSRDCPVPVDDVAPCGIIQTETLLDAIDQIL